MTHCQGNDDLLHFEDFTPGQKLALDGRYEVTREEIIDFAREYDPQPHHLDDEAAKKTMSGRIGGIGLACLRHGDAA